MEPTTTQHAQVRVSLPETGAMLTYVFLFTCEHFAHDARRLSVDAFSLETDATSWFITFDSIEDAAVYADELTRAVPGVQARLSARFVH